MDTLITEMMDRGLLFEDANSEFERRFIQKALERARGNRSLAAQKLGMHRNTLSRHMQELNLTPTRAPRRPKLDGPASPA